MKLIKNLFSMLFVTEILIKKGKNRSSLEEVIIFADSEEQAKLDAQKFGKLKNIRRLAPSELNPQKTQQN